MVLNLFEVSAFHHYFITRCEKKVVKALKVNKRWPLVIHYDYFIIIMLIEDGAITRQY